MLDTFYVQRLPLLSEWVDESQTELTVSDFRRSLFVLQAAYLLFDWHAVRAHVIMGMLPICMLLDLCRSLLFVARFVSFLLII